MAERVGFEPTEPVKAHSNSNAANSTTLAPFQKLIIKQNADLKKSKIRTPKSKIVMAERVGFEPTEPAKAQQFSRLPDSTTLAPLRELNKSLMPEGYKFQVGFNFPIFLPFFSREKTFASGRGIRRLIRLM